MPRISEAEAAALGIGGKPKRTNKFGAKRTKVDGKTFDSGREAKRYGELRLLERSGAISNLKTQVPFTLMSGGRPILDDKGRAIKYRADFTYIENGELVVEDSKGARTALYRLKAAIMLTMGYRIRET